MALLQTLYFIPCLGQEITDFLLQTVPLRRRRKVARYLQHVDLLRISEHRDRPFRLIVTAHFANA
ncbi:hypothetical protein EC913_1291 [Pseudomonas sp. LP_4_YM]|nr:hypothetical protein EC913_1291 [Pseudomonas sp. LP_4_YM]